MRTAIAIRGCLKSPLVGIKNFRDAMNRRLYNNQFFVETAIYRVFVMIYRIFAI
ncbi:hypothetical protein [Nostoc sp. 'Peltigera membranacea cyanobiont' 210A]|uniref:hypothetical protein n=1 Tax=Nostoc sp. 'Peltigera membranacea cyanobiont' 210A TaxID=2014529 RepID=UPI00167C9282|nr:hypothetical protein [Nostoc sp. 'Peltigera membranacea cyanobiont' 210A]